MKKTISTTDKCLVILRRSINFGTKKELSKELGISRPTLDKRITEHNWKKLEKKWVDYLYELILKTKK